MSAHTETSRPYGNHMAAQAATRARARSDSAAGAELIAARIGLLLQACDATAGLIGNALDRWASPPAERASAVGPAGTGWSAEPVPAAVVDALVGRTLSENPPVRRARRLNAAGELVLVDITAAPFGTGCRPCPGAEHARALAAGVLDALLPACAAIRPPDYPDSAALRIPSELFVMLR